MPTINQICNFIRKPKIRKTKTPALQGCAQKKGTCVKVFTKTPKKPNSAIRKVARLKLSNVLSRSFCKRIFFNKIHLFIRKIYRVILS